MKLDTHIKLNDVSIHNVLAMVLSLQIALWALMGLRVLGVSIPIVQPLIGFIYLTFVPGLLILIALRLRNLDIVETALYAVGLSVTVVLLIGLVVNIVLNALNLIKPFSFLAVTSSVSFVVLLLCEVAYYRNRTQPKPLFITEMSVPLAPTLFLCILPFLAVFSTYLVNYYNISAGQLFLWLLLSVVALLIAFDKFISAKLYPLAVFVIGLTLLFQQALISEWLIGSDIQTEWSLANSVLNTGIWNPNLLSQYNGMLSVVALAPINSLISSLELVWVFKIMYCVIFALVPVCLYQIYRRQLNDQAAFLACFFFMAFAGFYSEMPGLARQEVAELFCVLLILVLVSTEMNQAIQSALFIVFGLSMVVSHYGLTYIIVSFLFVTWLLLTMARVDRLKKPLLYLRTKFGVDRLKKPLLYLRTKFGLHEDKQIIPASSKPPPRSAVTIIPISVLSIALIAWYTYTAQATVIEAVASLGGHIAGSITQLFSPTYSQAANVAAIGPSPGILHRVNAYVNGLNVFFIVAGLGLTIFLKKQRFKLQFWYVVLSIVALGFLIACIVVPWLGSALNFVRVFHITLIVLAPFLVVGFITIGEIAGAIVRNDASKLRFGSSATVSHSHLTRLLASLARGFITIGEIAGATVSKVTRKLRLGSSATVSRSHLTRLLAIYLVFFLLLSTGFLFALTEDYHPDSLSNKVDGFYGRQTIDGATWVTRQASNSGNIPLSGKPVKIFHYFNDVRYDDTNQPTDSEGQITFTKTFNSAGVYYYYATFPRDTSYLAATSAGVPVNVGSNQATSEAATNVGPQTTVTLSASTTTPAVGQPVTFTAALTSGQVVYGDFFSVPLINALAPARALYLPPQDTTAGGFYIFLSTYNIEHNEVFIANIVGAIKRNYHESYEPFISNRSLIYSNGGASVYV